MLLRIAVVHSFLLLYNILLCDYIIVFLYVYFYWTFDFFFFYQTAHRVCEFRSLLYSSTKGHKNEKSKCLTQKVMVP